MLRILVIDDNPHDRILAIRSLEREFPNIQAQEILKAEGLAQALETGNFDLVITDYQLRWSDGLTVLGAIKARYPECPVIMFTNSGTQEIAVEAMKSGLDDYVLKSSKHYIRLAAAVRLAWERTQIQRKAMGLETRLQSLLNQLNVGIFRITLDGFLLEGNRAFFRLLGLPSQFVFEKNQSLEPYFQPEDYSQLLNQLKENGQIHDCEVPLRRFDGREIWVRLSTTISTIESQTIVEGLMEDISDRKRAEEERYRREQEFKALAQNAPDIIARFDQAFRHIYVNPAVERATGLSPELFIGKTNLDLGFPQKQCNLWHENIQLIFTTGQEHWFEFDFLALDGTRYYQARMVPELTMDGTVESVLCITRDVTESKLAEQALKASESRLRQQAEQLEQANRIKDEFLAVLSHELRSPLNAILGWTQLLRSRSLNEAARVRALETVERNAKLQTQLIEDLLDVSRIMRGTLSLNISLVNLASTIEVSIDTIRLAAQAKSIQIKTLIDPTVGFVSGDPNRLQQVIWNLLSNAVKFTPSNGRVTIVLERNGRQAQLRVIDTGKGISAEFIPYVFDYFRQADSSTTRAHGGLGLGLAIVRQLVELHGGTVSVSSPGVGQGATFTVNLPLTIDPILKDLEQGLSTVGNTQTFNNTSILSGKRVLVVDDEDDTRDFYTVVLEDSGASVIAVASAREALVAIEQQCPDVLISDIGMPVEDGYTLI
ncbi:MAG: PAS domain S-box protein, partial [Coleofasciculus sp. Co-bin14]|nr:PAS domain S-box protein [Coleofasciculus sp. Co-bin14]